MSAAKYDSTFCPVRTLDYFEGMPVRWQTTEGGLMVEWSLERAA
jgi:hypothetical protein